MAAAGAVLMGGGGILSSYGTLKEGYAAAAASDYNAALAEQNAVQAKYQAAEEERRQRVISRKALGDMRTSYAASGITMEGSALDVLTESAAAAELDALTIRHQGEVKATAYRNESALEKYKAKHQREAAKLGVASSLLSTGGKMAAAGG